MAAMTAGLSAILLHQVWCWGKGRVLPGSVLALAAARVASAAGLLCSLGAIFMARYTQGHEGFVMTGYIV
ncbi:hypothetical protein MNEG_8781 [Monoraphidium neglectum]|uniref:Uncharacterized protein n=1 Tax=Monoraphidium neglectum TaxID=145388 RepID=A0A0D2MYH2_9CHLO|nr:hypothetical protein MNEG_8781 [Monoraphidium neglectum]KIY99180.1 hypothetical protein MNEG_8781 [Monoraphidium neglectum]|eukprot:XP_013898200.1 hypothetical protein MNEG_8781 [Monoraphidium neglectum]